jgi:hypothetical protein
MIVMANITEGMRVSYTFDGHEFTGTVTMIAPQTIAGETIVWAYIRPDAGQTDSCSAIVNAADVEPIPSAPRIEFELMRHDGHPDYGDPAKVWGLMALAFDANGEFLSETYFAGPFRTYREAAEARARAVANESATAR